MLLEKNLARDFVRKNEIIPVIKIIMRRRIKILLEKCWRSSWIATAAPVLVFEIT